MDPILNYVEFRTNHEPYMVHGVVHGGMGIKDLGILHLLAADEVHDLLPPQHVCNHGPIIMSGSLNCPHPLSGAR